jgi:hypothetical protein
MDDNSKAEGFFCNLDALTEAERRRRLELAAAVARAAAKPLEISVGCALSLDTLRIDDSSLEEWIRLERRCCPFLNFRIRRSDEELLFEVTGATGVKEFLRAEFSR